MSEQKTEQQQIEEMAKNMCGNNFSRDDCKHCRLWDSCYNEAKNLYAAGYRKQSDVAKDIIKRLSRYNVDYNADLKRELNRIAAEFGAEVEK